MPVSVAIETSYLIEHRVGSQAEAKLLAQLAIDDFQVEQLSTADPAMRAPSMPLTSAVPVDARVP